MTPTMLPPQASSALEGDDLIYPAWTTQPYYIVTPRYERVSAGIKVLHMLAHALNRRGQRAWLLLHPYTDVKAASPDLLTPLLTDDIIDAHHRQGLNPIVVYPETVPGNPFRASCVARYVLNYPGLLGGDATFDPDEYCFGYTRSLAEACGQPDRVLFIPASDPSTFYPPPPGTQRQGTCYYWGKFQDYHQCETFGVPPGSVEISRRYPDKQGPKEIAAILRRSERLYVFENTALAIEAILCECPVVFMPNPHLTEVIAAQEMGWDGMAWGDSPEEIQRATATVGQAAQHYLKHFKQFWAALDRFIADTQTQAAQPVRPSRLIVPDLLYADCLGEDMIPLKRLKTLLSHPTASIHQAKTGMLVKVLGQRLQRELLRPVRKLTSKFATR